MRLAQFYLMQFNFAADVTTRLSRCLYHDPLMATVIITVEWRMAGVAVRHSLASTNVVSVKRVRTSYVNCQGRR